jgi:hypothetical protein
MGRVRRKILGRLAHGFLSRHQSNAVAGVELVVAEGVAAGVLGVLSLAATGVLLSAGADSEAGALLFSA